jgi:hypothetical protein
METLEGFGDFTMEGQVKYGDGLLLLAMKRRCYRARLKTSCNWKVFWNGNDYGNTKAMTNPKTTFPSTECDRSKTAA